MSKIISPETYEKDIYVINVKQVYEDLYQRIEQHLISTKQENYHLLEMLTDEFDFYCSQIKIKKKLSYSDDLKQYELLTTHPSFYKWLGFALTIQDAKSIVMQLQSYSLGKYGKVMNFNKSMEFQVIKFMAFMPFIHTKQDIAVERWIVQNNYAGEENSKIGNHSLLQSKDNSLKKIFILPDIQLYLKETLIDFLETQEQRSIFISIMEGYFLLEPNKISLNMRANVFCDLVKQIKDGKSMNITSNKKLIKEWICTNFLFNQRGVAKAIKPSYCAQLLAGRETPADGIRIYFKPTVTPT
jgi:hypothetical protein